MKESKVVLSVQGMTCINCELHIEETLTNIEGVTKADVSYRRGDAVVYFDEMRVSIENMIGAVAEEGYSAAIQEERKGLEYDRINKILIGAILVLGGYMVIQRTGLLNIINLFPQADENTDMEC